MNLFTAAFSKIFKSGNQQVLDINNDNKFKKFSF